MRARRSSLLFGALLALMPGETLGAGDDERVAWLRQNAIPIATLDPASRDFADLGPLRGVLGAARVVMLGEATRGDGAAFLAKTRLIRFLRQELGFDVLVFEGGFYDCARAWEEIRAGADVRRTLGRVLLPSYTEASQFQLLIDLVAANSSGDRPLIVAGIDNQMSGGPEGKSLAADLRAALTRFGIAPQSVSGFADLETVLPDLLLERYATGEAAVPSNRQQRRVLDGLAELRRRLIARREPQPAAGLDCDFWRQVLDNIESYAEASWRQGKWEHGDGFSPALHNLRDRQMGANLVWLARHRYRDHKLIVWSLNVHLARDLDRLTTGEPGTRARLDQMSTIGDAVGRALDGDVYTIALTAFAGHQGTPFRQPIPLLAPTRGSFEELMSRTGLEAALVDLRHLPASGSWLRRDLIARPISHKELLGSWPRHVDALLFLRQAEASRPVDGGRERVP